MNIAVDARIAHYNNSGISRFARGLLEAIALREPRFDLTVYQSFRQRRPLISGNGIKTGYLFTPPHFQFESWTLPTELSFRHHSVIHALDFYVPPYRGCQVLAQVYDLYFLREPRSLDAQSFNYYSRLSAVAPQIARFICSSEATKLDAIELLNLDQGQIDVIYPGYVPMVSCADDITAARKALGFDGPIILAVGTIEPRKNIERLIEAYSDCRRDMADSLPRLVLVGRKGYRAGEILSRIDALGLRSVVYHLGEANERELRGLYSMALVTAYVSLYEGFGFPLLEGLSAGSAVLASNCSSMPEVAGDAALYVDPTSTESIAAGLARLVNEPDLRTELRSKAATVLSRYSWDRCAKETIESYRRTAAE